MRHLTAVLALLALAAPVGAQSLKVVSFTGIVQVKMPNGDIYGFVPGAATSEIPAGSEVSVVSGQAVFTTPAGVTASVGSGDTFAYSGSATQAAFQSQAGSGLLVSYGTSEAAVAKGGKVAIDSADPAKASLSVVSGSAKVTSAGQTTTLAAGQSLKLPAPAAARAAAPARPAAPASGSGMMEAISQHKKGNLRLGAAEIHPYYGVTESYDSNIYLVPKDGPTGTRVGGGVRSAWITKNAAGVSFKLPLSGMHALNGGVDGAYTNYSKQGSINDYADFGANLGYDYSGPMGLKGRLADAYLNTADPAFSEQAGKRSQRWQNTASATLDYAPEGGRLVGGVSLSHVTHHYLDGVTLGPLLNRFEQTYGVNVGYMLRPKTKLAVGYRRQIIHYNTVSRTVNGGDKNNKSHFMDLSLSGVLAPKLKGQIQTGLQLKDYDQNQAGRITYSHNWIVATNLTWNPMERSEVNLGLSRAINESTFGTNRYYTSNTASLGVKHKLPYKLTARLNGSLSIDNYPETTTFSATNIHPRRDDTYNGGVGVDYDVQEWLKLGLDYSYGARFSIEPGQFNYRRHLTSLNARLLF